MLGNIFKIKGNIVQFEGGKENAFDAIVFATGYKSTANKWLKVHSNINVWSTMQQNYFHNNWVICVLTNVYILL